MSPKLGLLCIGILGAAAATGTTIHFIQNREEPASKEEIDALNKTWISGDNKDTEYEGRKTEVTKLLEKEENKELFKKIGKVGEDLITNQEKEKIKAFCESGETKGFVKYKRYHPILKGACTNTAAS